MPDPQNPSQQVTIEQWEEIVRDKYQIPRNLWRAMSAQESGGDWGAVSPTGVKGKYQVTEATARQYGLDRNDPYQQAAAAAKHLRRLFDASADIRDENARWLAAVGRYYGGDDAVDSQGNLSARSRDNLSNPAIHVERVAKKWGELNRAEKRAPQSAATPVDPRAGLNRVDMRAGGAMDLTTSQIERAGAQPRPQSPVRSQSPTRAQSPTRQQQMAALAEAMRARDFKPDVIAAARQRLEKMPNAEFAKESARLFKVLGTVPEYGTQRREMERKRAEYYAQPLYQQIGQEIAGGLARVGESAQRAANRLLRPALEALGFESEVQRGRRGEEAAAQKLAEQEEIASSLRSKIVRGGTQGAAAAATMAPLAMAGGAPAVVLGTAAQQDWERDPAGALAASAGAAIPVYAGRAISPVAARAAGAFSRPVARKAAQLGVEGLAGAGANVSQYAATQAALGRPVNPDDLIEQAVTGGVLSAALAPRLPAARAGAPAAGQAPADSRAPSARKSATQDFASRAEPGMLARDYVRQVEKINRAIADPQQRQAALDQARTQYQEARRNLRAAPQQATEQAPETAPAPPPALPEGVQIIREGETIPPRQRGQRVIPIEIAKDDGSAGTVIVIAPDRINGQRVSETMLRPMVENALRPQAGPQSAVGVVRQPRPQPPIQLRKAGEDVQVFRAGEQPEYDPATQKAVTFKGDDKQTYVAIAPKEMSRADAAVFGRLRIPQAPEPAAPLTKPVPPAQEMQPAQPAQDPDAPVTARPPQPPQPDTSQRLIERTRQRAEELIGEGRFDEAITELKAHQQALKDAKTRARKQPGLRVQIERQIGQAGNRIGQVRAMARQAGKARARAEEAPTKDLTSPLLQSEVNPEGGVPERAAIERQTGQAGNRIGQAGAKARQAGKARARAEEAPTKDLTSPLLQSEVNPEGGAPERAEPASGIVGALARQQRRGKGEPQDNIRINARIRQLGGINPAGKYTGELRNAIEKRYPGLINRRSGIKPDTLREMLRDEGYPVSGSLDSLFRAIDDDAAGRPVYPLTRSRTAEIEQEFADYYARQAEEAPLSEPLRGEPVTDPDLASAYRKLGTDNPDEISQLIRDADKRFKKSATPEEAEASARAWAKVQRLTPEEHSALARVIPERVFAPVREDYTGEPGERYSRAVSDIPLSEPNAQLDRNLNELLSFFDEVKDKPKPKMVQDAAQRLRDAASGKLAGSGGQQLVDVAIVVGWKVYERGMTYAKWAQEVIREAGEQVRPYLRKAWNQLVADYQQMEREARSLRGRLSISPETRAKAIADNPYNDEKVSVASLGLESRFPPSMSAKAKARDIEVDIDDITLGRDDLSKGRMYQVEQALKEGFQSETRGKGRLINAVEVVPDPRRPGKWIVSGDGNHRVALLKLAGVKGKIPVKAWEAPAGRNVAMANVQRGVFPDHPNYWKTPALEKPPTSTEELQSLIDNARAEFRQRGRGEAGTLWTNAQGAYVIGSAARQKGILTTSPESLGGLELRIDRATELAEFIRDKADAYGNSKTLTAIADQIDAAVIDAQANGKTAIILTDSTITDPVKLKPTLGAAKFTVREERFHGWQREAGLMTDERGGAVDRHFANDPVYQKIRAKLIENGYDANDPAGLAIEVPAKLASGQAEYFDVSPQEAYDLLYNYADFVTRNYGADIQKALRNFTPSARAGFEDVAGQRPARTLGRNPFQRPGEGTGGSRGNAPSLRTSKNAGGKASGNQGSGGQAQSDLTLRERIGRKIGTAQAIAQLGNPRTILQNLIGNAAFSGAKNVATLAALPIDKLLSLRSGQRQVAMPELRTQVRDFVDGFADVWHAVKVGDSATLTGASKYDIGNERAFKGKVGKFAEDVMDIALRGPDRGAYLAAYNDAVAQIHKGLARSKKPFSLDQIHEQAKMEAQQAVFQDDNIVSRFTVGLKKVLNQISPFGEKANFGLADVIGLKYPRIPAGLAARAIEYSPVSFAKAIYKAGKVLAGKGKDFDQREASLAFGKAFTGSAFGAGMGALLYHMGVIVAPEKEDRGVAAAERSEGLGGYQINLSALKRYAMGGLFDGGTSAGKKQPGDILMTYNWLQPWAFALGMGAAAAQAHQKSGGKKELLEDVLGQIDAAASTLTDQSILRNIRDAFRYGLASTLRRAAADTPASFVPAVLNQVRQIIDDRAREISREKGARGIGREALDKVLNRLPAASKRLPERRDIVGRPVPSRLEGAAGAALVPVPGQFSEYRPHPVLSEMQRLETGSTGPQRKPGETAGQFAARRARAQQWLNVYGLQLVSSGVYRSASKMERQKAFEILRGRIAQQSSEQKPKLDQFNPDSILRSARETLYKRP